jgi:hypothetical protein
MGLTNNTGKLSNTLTSNGTQITLGGSTVTDGHLLNIIGSSATSNIGVVLNKTNSTAQIWGITNVGALTFYDYTAASERMRISTGGSIGIGNTVADTINSSSGLGNLVVGNGGGSSQGITIYTNSSTYGGLNFADATSGGGAYAGYIKFDHTNDSMGFFIGNTQRLSIASTGAATFSSTNLTLQSTSYSEVRSFCTTTADYANFIVDTNNNTNYRLQIVGFGTTASGDLAGISRAGNGFLVKSGGLLAVGTRDINALVLSTNETERARITGNNGNLLIGITSDYAFQGGAVLRVNREQNTGTNIQINNQAANANAAAHVIFSTNGNGWVVGMGSQQSSSGNTFYFSPDPSGALNKVATLTTGGVWSTSGGGTSDLRTKEDIDYNFDNGIESILKLQPTKFKFKTAPDKQRRGFIAQDVLDVIPDLVLGDGEKENGTYGLDYDGILALAVKAIQELTQKVNALENK